MPGRELGLVGDEQSGLVVAQSGDGELADGPGVGRQDRGGVVVDADAAGLVPSPAQGDEPGAAVVEFGLGG